jgi:ABC-type phosphate transport system substrate-binding protein
MSDTIFNRTIGETFSETRDLTSPLSTGYSYYPANSAEDLTKYVTTNGDAIGFMTSHEAAKHRGVLYEVPIMNSEHMIAPDALNIFDGRYPLMQNVYMNLYNDHNSLKFTQPFIEFGLSDEGQSLAEYAGYTRLANPLRTVMHTRAQTAFGISTRAVEQTQKMGCATHSIKGSGAGPAIRLVDYWAGIYEVACGITFHSTTVGSQYGAARVCAEPGAGAAVEVALMSRPVLANEATPREGSVDGTVYDCVKGDKSRSLLQAHIASDGMAFAVKKGGVADDCITLLGGLSMDQIRWMFSSLSEEELVAEGEWDAGAIPNSDNNPETHKWSELHAECAENEIRIAGLNGVSCAAAAAAATQEGGNILVGIFAHALSSFTFLRFRDRARTLSSPTSSLKPIKSPQTPHVNTITLAIKRITRWPCMCKNTKGLLASSVRSSTPKLP